MFNVNSKDMMRLLSRRTMKSHSGRNAVAILAITLTTVLFSSLFTIGGGLAQLFQEGMLLQVGGSAHETAQYLSVEEYEKISSYQGRDVTEIEYNVVAGMADEEALKKTHAEIRYGSDRAAELMLCRPAQGSLPRGENEIAMGSGLLELLGLPASPGQEVSLRFKVNGQTLEKTFTLSGYWDTNDHMIWISREYGQKIAPPLETPENFDDQIDGTLAVDVNFTNPWQANQKMENLLVSVGLDPETISYRANSAYITSLDMVEMGTVFSAAVLLFVVALSGYLIIYNIFYISVAQEIQYYGLLKTIGMSGVQLKRLVRGQALGLSLIGIPIGTLAGYAVGRLLLPSIASQLDLMGLTAENASVSPLILAGSALFSLLTVYISCIRPCRLAARVSPVEALRYTDAGPSLRAKRKRSGSCSPVAMAVQNLKRSRSKALLVVLSLTLSLTLLNATYTIISGFDLDKYVKQTAFSDFCVTHYTVANASAYETDENGIPHKVSDGVSPSFLGELAAREGIEFVTNIYALNSEHQLSEKALTFLKNFDGLKPSDVPQFDEVARREKTLESGADTILTYGMDTDVLAQLPCIDGAFDKAKWESGKYALVTDYFHEAHDSTQGFYNIGDTISLEGADGMAREYTVMAIMAVPLSSLGTWDESPWSINAILPTDEFSDLYGQRQPLRTIFDVDDAHLDATQAWVDDFCTNKDTDLAYISRETYKKAFESTKNTFLTVGGTLSLTLAFIGLLNFINAVLTSFLARRKELSMLQAIGMSGKQLKSMLIAESMAYIAVTFLTTSTIGSLLGYYLTNILAANQYAFSYHFTLLPVLACLPMLCAVAAIVPLLFYRHVSSRSVVERLRTD